MAKLPFQIPKSFSSYVEQFDGNPEKTIRRLKKQLEKQGPNAVGFFLLAWFHHLQDNHDQAVSYALQASIHAPGSPFFKKLHYYFSHPQLFEAFTREETAVASPASGSPMRQAEPVLDLDTLISRLSRVESRRIQLEEEGTDGSVQPPESDDVDDIISDTLADIHARQGKTDLAIKAYKRLKSRNKEKKEYYTEQIRKLKKLREKEQEEE